MKQAKNQTKRFLLNPEDFEVITNQDWSPAKKGTSSKAGVVVKVGDK